MTDDERPPQRARVMAAAMADAFALDALSRPRTASGSVARALGHAVGCSGWWQLVLHRVAHASAQRRSPGISTWRERALDVALWLPRIVLKLLTKNELVESTMFEPGVVLSSRGGIVLGARRIGAGTIVHHDVTIGRNLASGGVPTVGRSVWIGHGSVLHGDITIGDGATILPGTILTKSLPPRALVRGNPASIVARDFDNWSLRSTLDPTPSVPPRQPTSASESAPAHVG